MNVLLHLLSVLCPDVVQIVTGETTGVVPTSAANVARKLLEHFYSTGVRAGEERDGI